MNPINWERQPGETVEEFVEALILTTANPRAVRITPSRGDKGIDIIAPVEDNKYDVYQVKRYTRPFSKSSSQEKSIVNSWKRFVKEILPNYPIRRWHLVMPWNPTPERYEWLRNVVTAGATVEVDWVGRGKLDVWAAQNPPLQDYFFGGGQGRTIELIASALASREEIVGLTGQPLLDAVAAREVALSKQLDEVDPFYRYESTIRRGRLRESPPIDQMIAVDKSVAFVTCREINDNHYLQLAVYPKCADAFRLRPISTTVSIDSSSIDEETIRAAHDMIEYGAEPDRPIPVKIVESKGPPGADSAKGPAIMYVFNVSQPALSDLELRHGERRVGLTSVSVTHGASGVRMMGREQSGVFELSITLDHANKAGEVEMRTLPISGKLPHSVLDGLKFIEQWAAGGIATLAIPHGHELMPLGSLADSSTREEAGQWLQICRNLVRLQGISVKQLPVPTSLSGTEVRDIEVLVRLLDKEIVESDWTSTQIVVQNTNVLQSSLATGPLFQFLFFARPTVEYDDVKYELDGTIGTWGVAVLAEPSVAESVASGDSITIVPGPEHKLFRQYSPKSPESLDVPGFTDA